MTTAVERLPPAVREVNKAAQTMPPLPLRSKVKSIEQYCSVLDDAAADTNLWEHFAIQARCARSSVSDDAWAILTSAAEPLSQAHVNLLISCGYAIPPPPTVDTLVFGTRAALLGARHQPRWGRRHIDDARLALIQYVAEVRSHLRWWWLPGGRSRIDRALIRCRRSATIGLLLMLISHAEIKTGANFEIEVGVSLGDGIKVEISIPVLRDELEKVKPLIQSVLLNSQFADFGQALWASPDERFVPQNSMAGPGEPGGAAHRLSQENVQRSEIDPSDSHDEQAPQADPAILTIDTGENRRLRRPEDGEANSRTVIKLIGSNGEVVEIETDDEPSVGSSVDDLTIAEEENRSRHDPDDDYPDAMKTK